MRAPYLGASVYYVDGLGKTYAAIVAEVVKDTAVILTVFQKNHTTNGVHAVLGDPGTPRSWFWPPEQ